MLCFQVQADQNFPSSQKIHFAGSFTRVSDSQEETTGLLGVRLGISGNQSAEAEMFRAHRFGATNSQVALKYETKILSGIVFNFGGGVLTEDAEVTHLPYSSLFVALEYPIAEWGSGLGEFQTRFYSGAKVFILSYGLAISKMDSWLVIPKFYLSQLDFTTQSKQSTGAAFGLRIVHPISNFDFSMNVSAGKEVDSVPYGIVSTELVSGGMGFRYRGNKTWNPNISYQWENRPQLDRESHRVEVGLEMSSW